ncbi:hypothetical protein F4810DRAFT_619002 [Camillea tinctor]|nr:hypothetical protein F4810DRAFT_619002 [Camillea tinctor]
MIWHSLTPVRRIFLLLLVSTVVLSFDTTDTHNDALSLDIDQYDNPTQLHDPLNYVVDDGDNDDDDATIATTKLTLERRLDIPGTDIDLDTLADDVYSKVTSKVDGAIDDAKKGLNETIEAAKDGVNDAIDAAKGVLDDIKNSVEDLYQKVKDKVAEIEQQLGDAVKNWVWEHIGKPLVTVLIILLLPFALLILWWLSYHVAKVLVAADKKRRKHDANKRVQWEMQTITGGGAGGAQQYNTHTEPVSGPGAGIRIAALVVSSWERLGQGVICLLCPWYGSFKLWRDRNNMDRKITMLEGELEKMNEKILGLQAEFGRQGISRKA